VTDALERDPTGVKRGSENRAKNQKSRATDLKMHLF